MVFMRETGHDFTLLVEADPLMALYDVRPTAALFLVDGEGLIRFNLYETMMDDSQEAESMGHKAKAARRAPFWAAKIRHRIDQVLADAKK